MKVHFLLFIFVLIGFFNCVKDKNPIDAPNKYSTNYFPLEVGNKWYYDSPTPQTNPYAVRMIKSSFTKNNQKYYIWTYGESVDYSDTIRKDKYGNIWRLIDNQEYLWFDFTCDSGSEYTTG
jgi:hypothetical protein